MTALCDLSATAVRSLIARKVVSPVELTESCIERIEAVNPAVNAMVATDLETARHVARQQERQVMQGEPLGALFGLPLAVKDMVDAAGLPTTFGSLARKDNIARQDERLVAVLRAAGAWNPVPQASCWPPMPFAISWKPNGYTMRFRHLTAWVVVRCVLPARPVLRLIWFPVPSTSFASSTRASPSSSMSLSPAK